MTPFSNRPIAPGRVRLLGHDEGDHGQSHADKDHLAVADLARCGGDHQFTESVGGVGFGDGGVVIKAGMAKATARSLDSDRKQRSPRSG